MRIADNMMFDQVRGNVAKNRSEMADLQNQAATQKRVTKPSDDPISAARVLGSRVDLHGNKQFIKNLEYAKSFLETTDQALADVTENLMRAKELAISQANDASANEQSRRVTAAEIEQIFNQMVAIGNRKLGDRFIFGGFQTMRTPFSKDGEYRGDDGEMMIHTDKTQFMAMNVPGRRVFLGPEAEKEAAPELAPQGEKDGAIEQPSVNMRGPSSVPSEPENAGETTPKESSVVERGINLFAAVRNLEISMTTNDKPGVQDSIDDLDAAIEQAVLMRAQVGSRVTALNNLFETLQKAKVESQVSISQHEDADVFQVVSDINKNESTLQATLQTSGKLVQKSLMDFLR